ncbi:hypothetical protein [Microscilla marina]|uniref:hypothetical protein n=1 Tax=Microscilla marina TaxID=1027 RepID=UPI0002F5CE8C|nr:hypothetical protein [Microscilla marina]
MLRLLYPLYLICWLTLLANAQTIRNPSFEGTPGTSTVPVHWLPCQLGSTPDIQPGYWLVTLPPSDGKSYLSLVCRYDSWEACQQQLSQPLLMGKCYQYTIDLAYSPNFAGSFGAVAQLRVWGGTKSCKQSELLWESGPVKKTAWQRYLVELAPQKANYPFIILEVYYVKATRYEGNLLLDNFRFKQEVPCQF